MPASPHTFGFFLVPDFALLPFASATDALRAANWLNGETLYDWRFISKDGAPVSSSNGIPVAPHMSIQEAGSLDDLVIVAGGRTAPGYHDNEVFAWLRRLARGRCRVGGIGLGSFVLGRAGLLHGYRCTIHWDYLSGFRHEFPDLDVTDEVYEIDRDRYTCSGGTGALDLMLALIARQHGNALATRVAEEFIHERIRTSEDEQRMALRARLNIHHPQLLSVVETMERNLEEPRACSQLAEAAGLSNRQLERLFHQHLGCTPRQYYLQLRLRRARTLLTQTSLPIIEVALACGFTSPSHFSKAYRAKYQRPPSKDRDVTDLAGVI